VHNHEDLLGRALAARVVAIIRLTGEASLVGVAEALVEGGLRALEFTMTTPGALDAISACRDRFGEDVLVGAGTVVDADGAHRCLDAGAQFIVAPDFNAGVVAETRRAGALAMPGAFTPTEIVAASHAGASIVKVFPVRALGPQYIKDILAPLPSLLLMPTGGVSAENAATYLRAGAVAVGVGGNLVARDAVERRDWRVLTERARSLVGSVREAK
jgi:2-dehydro-3-deoxyphosphogluconate aldolase/(4S)-4-hydroxy-2-oxoglutarate aldolase